MTVLYKSFSHEGKNKNTKELEEVYYDSKRN